MLQLLLSRFGIMAMALFVWTAFVGAKAYSYGDSHGENARLYRAVVAELAEKNRELEALAIKDERETAEENAAQDVAAEFATEALKNLGSCPMSKAQAELLNKIGG